MAMNLNGTQIPADGVRTTTLDIRGVCVGSYVREEERERERKGDMTLPVSRRGRGSRRSYPRFRVQRAAGEIRLASSPSGRANASSAGVRAGSSGLSDLNAVRRDNRSQ